MKKIVTPIKAICTKLFGFQIGDNVLLKRKHWRKVRYGIIYHQESNLSRHIWGEPVYLVRYGKKRGEELEVEYTTVGIFKEKDMELDKIQRVKTLEEWQKENKI